MRLPHKSKQLITSAELKLQSQIFAIKQTVKRAISSEEKQLDVLLKSIEMSNPQFVLNRGYSYTEKNGKKVMLL